MNLYAEFQSGTSVQRRIYRVTEPLGRPDAGTSVQRRLYRVTEPLGRPDAGTSVQRRIYRVTEPLHGAPGMQARAFSAESTA